jgi:UDP-sugar diphosphatase
MHSNITNIEIKEVIAPKDSKVYEISYIEDGKKKSKVVSKSLNVVKILIYHKDKKAFVLTKQFRPLVYINQPQFAYRYELCGGREDKPHLTSKEVAMEEILEECGYKVEDLEYVTTFITTAKMTLYYVEVDESMRVSEGGGVDDENIENFYLPIDKAKEFAINPKYPNRPAMAFAIWWWDDIKKPQILSS